MSQDYQQEDIEEVKKEMEEIVRKNGKESFPETEDYLDFIKSVIEVRSLYSEAKEAAKKGSLDSSVELLTKAKLTKDKAYSSLIDIVGDPLAVINDNRFSEIGKVLAQQEKEVTDYCETLLYRGLN